MYRLCTTKCSSFPNMTLTFGSRHKRKNALIYGNNASAGCWWYPGAKRSHTLDPLTRAPCAAQLSNQKEVNLGCSALSKRQQSTTITNAEKQPVNGNTKIRKHKPLQYVELMEVTGNSSSESRARVQRMNAKKLQNFIKSKQMVMKQTKEKKAEVRVAKVPLRKLQPVEYQRINMESLDSSIIASGLYDDRPMIFCSKETDSVRLIDSPNEIKNILKSFQNFRDFIEGIDHEKDEPLESYSLLPANFIEADVQVDSLETSEPYVLTDATNSDSNKTTDEPSTSVLTKSKLRFKSKVHISEEQERLGKERAIRINLNTYLNVCIAAGLVSRGLSIIMTYRQRAINSPQQSNNLITIELYNILLHGFAEKGLFGRFKEIFKLIEEDGIAFNEQTFAALFECLGRLEPTAENNKQIKDYIEKANQLGFTLNNIMDHSKFVKDQRQTVLQAIQRIEPDFSPIYTPPELGYYNPLLNHLNKDVRSFDEVDLKLSRKNEKLSGSEIMHPKYGFTKEDLLSKAREQLQLELSGSITIKSIEKSKAYPNAEYCREKLKEIEVMWRQQIHDALLRDINTIKAQMHYKPNGFMNYYTYLRTIDSAHFVEILLKEIFKMGSASETYSPTVSHLYKDLGLQVQKRFQLDQKQKNGIQNKLGDIYSEYCYIWDENSNCQTSDNSRQMWQRLVHEHRETGPSMDIYGAAWPSNVLYGVGRFLYNILMRDIKIDSQVMRTRQKTKSKQQNLMPAFYSLFRNKGRSVTEEVKPHPLLARLIRASRQETLTFESNLVPMLCPPQPWTTPYTGGYLLNQSDLIRLPHQAVQQWERINSLNPQMMYPALDSLNQLASIPWRVNTDVLDVIIEVFQKGGDHKIDVPQPPHSLPSLPKLEKQDTSISSAERAKLFKEKLGHRRKQAEMFSLWCDTLYRLSLANHYRDKVFWLPHNMDFRGRVYPIPPHLNHLGSDLARSMLVFDKPQPLGADGFSWLKLHCINLTGLKKRDSVRERLLYAEDIIEEILDSADRPLTGRKWWTTSDEPWQTLACCQEIAKVHRSSDREGYLSRFPIHQDGSCNGLQHYAALGRDKAGGYSVNLSSSKVPQDVYSAVVTLVEKSRQQDAANGIHVADALAGFVQRKVIKQTVMTTVYGVTRFGARLQIARQLKDIDRFPKEWVWPASTYLTTKTFESLREMFTSTREIQDWFTDCARLISSVRGKNVEWITPLGLPIVQPYNRIEGKNVERIGSRVSENMSMDLYERPNVMKQKNAFPPNFIHSLDSSHMMLTSLHCERKGMTFVSVHDCFWTHACTVPDMNKICREQFVALHSQPILEDLSKFLQDRYSFNKTEFGNDGPNADAAKRNLNRVLGLLPQKGDFDLRNVLNSTYFFS